jgi:hypothetical protein
MFSKSWVKLIILLFLGTIIPLIFNNYVFDVVEGNVALSKACASGTGAVGACAAIGGAAAQATAAKAAADLARANKTVGAPAAVGENNEEAEEDSEFAELFTVNNDRTNEFAYAYVTESFVEGAAVKKTPLAPAVKNPPLAPAVKNPPLAPAVKNPPLAPAVGKNPWCKIVSRLDKNTKLLDINEPKNRPTLKYMKKMTDWYKRKC